jgi:hypothetical protein
MVLDLKFQEFILFYCIFYEYDSLIGQQGAQSGSSSGVQLRLFPAVQHVQPFHTEQSAEAECSIKMYYCMN